jgi:putative iron-dependent peroxidase
VATAQLGIFALGTVEHFYVELDLVPGTDLSMLARGLAELAGPETSLHGINVVVGVRPSLWAELSGNAPADAADFDEDIVGAQGYRMPATQHDAWLWISGGARDAVFDAGVAALTLVKRWAFVATELGGWLYQHDRDLTGFIDGTKNPSQLEAYDVAVVPSGPGAGSSVVLVQQWQHQSEAFMQLPVEAQERIIGRSKPDSIELDESVMPPTSHVTRTTIERDGVELSIFRRNTAYGGVTQHGTLFVGFSQEQFRLAEMLRRMAGVGDGVRDALTRFTTPLTGAYYVVPATEELLGLLADP